MTTFELREDYRTASYEAMGMLGLNQDDINEAAGFHDLFKGLTPAKRQLALAAVEVYRLFSYRERKQQIYTSRDIYQIMQPYMQDLEHEEAWAIFMNQSYKVMKVMRLSVGGLASTLVDVRILYKEALLSNAASLAFIHNHPSGSTRPSREDDRLTEEVKKAGQLMNIKLIDHLIFTDCSFYSYADEGRL